MCGVLRYRTMTATLAETGNSSPAPPQPCRAASHAGCGNAGACRGSCGCAGPGSAGFCRAGPGCVGPGHAGCGRAGPGSAGPGRRCAAGAFARLEGACQKAGGCGAVYCRAETAALLGGCRGHACAGAAGFLPACTGVVPAYKRHGGAQFARAACMNDIKRP